MLDIVQVVATPSQVTGKDGDMQQVSSYTSDLAELISGVVKVRSLPLVQAGFL